MPAMPRAFIANRFARTASAWRNPALIALVATVAVSVTVYRGLAQTATDRSLAEAEAILDQSETTIRTWFGRYRALPAIYGRDPRIRSALAGDPAPGTLDDTSRELAELNDIAGTLDTYILRPDGVTVAASNWREDHSFVGQDYTFRPYYTEAIDGRETTFFGLGTMSGLRGYYLSAPVIEGDEILGVVVVKVSIDALEDALSHGPHSVFVTDDAGVAIISPNPELRMTSVAEAGQAARDEVLRTRRYELDEIGPAPIEATGGAGADWPVVRAPAPAGDDMHRYLEVTRALPQEDWRLTLLYDLRSLRSFLLTAGAAILASAVAALALAMLTIQRRRRLVERLATRERDRARLTRRVASRTAELTAANTRLEAEVVERRAAEESLRRTQNELVQAGKLAALGQMSAALSHEFNQPLTAIRTYAENAAAFYDAGRGDRAAENLHRILGLTDKVAQLSKHLTRFARRTGDDVRPVDLDQVIGEALALLSARIEKSGASVAVTGASGTAVMGGATRLQHVLMNLVTNAIDAAPVGEDAVIGIHVEQGDGQVVIAVTDRGSGIAETVLERIFDPFFTTKEVGRGLGLGLSISFNIVKDFGGTLRAENRDGGGARLTVTLIEAAAGRIAAE